uniref:Uncharacterized protein n=1 Tax=Bosea sp. NBC_00436 TaxID=2969620 RepID=A0A9E7ZXX2_9HYPH
MQAIRIREGGMALDGDAADYRAENGTSDLDRRENRRRGNAGMERSQALRAPDIPS